MTYALVDVGGLWVSPSDIIAIRAGDATLSRETCIWLRGVAEPLPCTASPSEILSDCDEATGKHADGDWP